MCKHEAYYEATNEKGAWWTCTLCKTSGLKYNEETEKTMSKVRSIWRQRDLDRRQGA
jgi:hypothetical protein